MYVYFISWLLILAINYSKIRLLVNKLSLFNLFKNGLTSRARLVDRGCHSFLSKKSGTMLQTTKDQKILIKVWRIPQERISINALQERLEEATGVYAKDNYCSKSTDNKKYSRF